MTEAVNPKAFISYSRTSPEHGDRVRDLADQLMDHGVDVLLDQYDIGPGQNLFDFMEKSVKDPKVNKVLVICDKAYAEKADARKGGVGTESTIISPEVYSQLASQTQKFVAVIFEKDEDGNAYIPTMFKSSLYIDMSTEDAFVENFELLVRFCYDKPALRKKPLGRTPTFILQDEELSISTLGKYQQIKNHLEKERFAAASALLTDYFDALIAAIHELGPAITGQNLDHELAFTKYKGFIRYRDDFYRVCKLFVQHEHYFNGVGFEEHFRHFLERAVNLPAKVMNDWLASSNIVHSHLNDHIELVVWDLLTHHIALCLEYRRYAHISSILNAHYLFEDTRRNRRTMELVFEMDSSMNIFETHRKRALGERFYSVTGEILKNSMTVIRFEEYMQAETILLVFSKIIHNAPYRPFTLPYWESPLPLYVRAESIVFADALARGLGFTDAQDFKEKLRALHEMLNPNQMSFRGINFPWAINYEKFATK